MLAAFNPTYRKHLEKVTTRSQAARDYGVALSTVQNWIDKGYVAAEKVGATWLISIPSLVALRGPLTVETDYKLS